MDGKIYRIIYKPTGLPCYIGRTVKTLRERFNAHCSRNIGTKLNEAIIEYGKGQFEIQLVQGGITSQKELIALERKYILEYSAKYKLYNGATVVPNKGISIKQYKQRKGNFHGIMVQCVENKEIFPSLKAAAIRYNVSTSSIHEAIRHGYCAGYDSDNNPLHWIDVNNPTYKKKEIIFKVYVIQQLINNQWVPIYVGQTRNELRVRFNRHKLYKTGPLYEVLHKYPIEQFRIKAVYNNIPTQKETDELEMKLTQLLMKRYKLYNKNIGTHNMKVTPSTKLQVITWKDIKDNSYLKTNELCKCVEDDLYFLTHASVATQYNVPIIKAKNSIGNVLKCGKGEKHIISINTNELADNTLIYSEMYSIYCIRYKNLSRLLVTKLPYNEVLPTVFAKKDVGISGLISHKKDVKLEIVKSYIFFKEEAEAIKNELEGKSKVKKPKFKPVLIRCVNTGEVFNSFFEASERYNIGEDSIWKTCKGLKNGFKDKETGEIIVFEYVNPMDKLPKFKRKNEYNVFIVYENMDGKEVPIYVSFSVHAKEKDILIYHKGNSNSDLHDKLQNGYDKFSIKFIGKKLDDSAAKALQKETVRKLIKKKYVLLNK